MKKLSILWVLIILFEYYTVCFSCVEEERNGLLKLKPFLKSYAFERADLLLTWVDNENNDCTIFCQLDFSVPYSDGDKHVLNASLFLPFQQLQYLDLSYDHLFDLQNVLDLGRLKKLNVLKLSGNVFNTSRILQSLFALTSLTVLDLSANDISGSLSDLGKELCKLKNLNELYLGYNMLSGSIPICFNNLTFLKVLDLSSNYINGSLSDLNRDSGSLKKLEMLFLDDNFFNNNHISQSLFGLTSLIVLDLSRNEINEPLSNLGRELCKLKKLRELSLGYNTLSGSIPTCFNNLMSLRTLVLSNNQLSGNLHPSLLISLTKLEYFSLSANPKLEVNIMFNSLGGSHREFHLKYLDLSNCNLNTSVTDLVKILHKQPNLLWLDISNNNLYGEFSNLIFANNSRLKILNLKNNSLTGHIHFPVGSFVNLVWLDVSHNRIQGKLQPNIGEILPKLRVLNLANNDLRGEIPISLLNMKDLQKFDLSNNILSGKIPERLNLSCKSLRSIWLSNNRLEGQIPDTLFNLTTLSVLDISDNQIFGNIPSTGTYINFLDISQNHISGRIPRWLGNSSFFTLFMHNNSIEGHIPPELCNSTTLKFLDLSQNQLSGHVPSCLTTLPYLESLHLHHNKFTGLLPKALTLNTSRLLTLDLSHNNLSGKIPNWIGFFPNLRVLLLKKNRFSGSIPYELCRLPKIGIMDLSHNSLSGPIPLCFSNITFSIDEKVYFTLGMGLSFDNDIVTPDLVIKSLLGEYVAFDWIDQQDDVEFVMKSRSNSYKGDIIKFMSGIDLSCNDLKGNIPLDIGALTDLRALNLSHNLFTGVIPSSLSNMKQIESIDLSHNKLNGGIPSSLTRLSFLVVFTVAYNNLSGRVPEMVAQFSTFNETSYEGNPFLCGPPLLGKQCNNNTDQVTTTDALVGRNDVFGIDPICFLASFAATYVTCLLGIVIVLCINPYWRRRWFHFIDTCLSFIFPSWY